MARQDLIVHDSLTIPGREIEPRFTRSSGPGGQNLNKVSSRVELRFAFRDSQALTPEAKVRLAALAKNRLSADGHLLVTSQRHREQHRNLDDCYRKLRELIRAALVPPTPRLKTVPSRGANERRLLQKKRRAEAKKRRTTPMSE